MPGWNSIKVQPDLIKGMSIVQISFSLTACWLLRTEDRIKHHPTSVYYGLNSFIIIYILPVSLCCQVVSKKLHLLPSSSISYLLPISLCRTKKIGCAHNSFSSFVLLIGDWTDIVHELGLGLGPCTRIFMSCLGTRRIRIHTYFVLLRTTTAIR